MICGKLMKQCSAHCMQVQRCGAQWTFNPERPNLATAKQAVESSSTPSDCTAVLYGFASAHLLQPAQQDMPTLDAQTMAGAWRLTQTQRTQLPVQHTPPLLSRPASHLAQFPAAHVQQARDETQLGPSPHLFPDGCLA
jgi:hypothetical protein